jgi:tetratricopeptide (TPR) repeat protein
MVEDLDRLDALQTQIGRLRAYEDDAQALALAQEAYALIRKLPDPEHLLVAITLTNLAELYDFFMDNYATALPIYEQALQLWRRLLGADHPFMATMLNSLAGCYYVLGDYAAAQPLYEQAQMLAQEPYGLRLRRPVHAVDPTLGAASFFANLSRYLGRPVHAVDPILLSTILNNRATLYREIGDYAAALGVL